ncbi:MAG: peptidase M20 [Coxiella sp. RIFCSPHIGHO2_12_FULL_42_15]|nr:MAG: peptidase M20 [Coxiella sp. RIFCSPHIGHO2_12_FULL_42_15]
MSHFERHFSAIQRDIATGWDEELVPLLQEYIKIPNKSPEFDPQWEEHGYMQQAMNLIFNWVQKQPIDGMHVEIITLPKRTPLLFVEIPGQIAETILLYGHMDKQPETSGWDIDKGPWKPTLVDNKLYGRGGADDGYSTFASLTAIAMLQRYHIPHARCVLLIEGCEESGSFDLPFYLEQLDTKIGEPNFVICLDSCAGNYEQMWSTTSLRGMVSGKLEIQVTREGIHSGLGSGVVPPIEIILRQLLDRIEDSRTGKIVLPGFEVDIPKLRIEQTQQAAKILRNDFLRAYPFVEDTQPVSSDLNELILNRSWRSQLSITGIEGYPALINAGNVTLPKAVFKLSMRIPPTAKSGQLSEILKTTLEKNPPFKAKITFTSTERATGWHAPPLAEWLRDANERASQYFFNKSALYIGEGGLIPFMGMLGKKFPQAQFLITGVLGPGSNAHGPNEFLHIPYVKGITGCVASVIASHYETFRGCK